MIKNFKHAGLERFYRTESKANIDPSHAKKLKRILTVLDSATNSHQLQGLKAHTLRYGMAGQIAVEVTGNWRVTFRFEGHDVVDVDYLDYH